MFSFSRLYGTALTVRVSPFTFRETTKEFSSDEVSYIVTPRVPILVTYTVTNLPPTMKRFRSFKANYSVSFRGSLYLGFFRIITPQEVQSRD